MNRHKIPDAILALTALGALLLLPPILPYFDRPITIFGAPLIVVYVFGIWLALIGLGWLLFRRLPRSEEPFPPTTAIQRSSSADEKAD